MTTLKISLEEALRDKTTAPRPISIEEYWRRHKRVPNKERTEDTAPKKKRGGKRVKQRQEIGNLYRLATIATTKKEKKAFLQKIQEIRKDSGPKKTTKTAAPSN